MINKEAMLIHDRISACGQDAKDDLTKACEKCGIEDYHFLKPEDVEPYLEICREVLARWHTTDKFKVGDKVYVDPGKPTFAFTNYIRATVTEISTDGWGYHLRAFEQDLPGIFMFNIWDKDLLSRTDKANKPLPESHYEL
jgi:hypothetical protein